MFDGIQRPLDAMRDKTGDFLDRVEVNPLAGIEYGILLLEKVGDKVALEI